jgi:hypothetical protein
MTMEPPSLPLSEAKVRQERREYDKNLKEEGRGIEAGPYFL